MVPTRTGIDSTVASREPMQHTIEYPELHSLMRACALTQGPAEAQGAALGLQAVERQAADRSWAAEFYADMEDGDANVVQCRERLDRLRAEVEAQLHDGDLGLALLLPDGPAIARAQALSTWCQGFLFGVGTAGAAILAKLTPEGKEALHDFGEITRMDVDEVGDDEEAVAMLTELEEYVRMAAIVVIEDVHRGAGGEGG